MMNLINSIGQRKVSKILIGVAVIAALLSFLIRPSEQGFMHPLTLLGIFLMSAPVAFLSRAAHKTKDYRIFCLISQVTIIILNLLLYFLNIPDFFFILTLIELIATLLFTLLFAKRKPVKKVIRKTRTKENEE